MATGRRRDRAQRLLQGGYESLHQGFRWLVPEQFNMAEVCARRWAAAPDASQRIAVLADGAGATPRAYSYAELQQQANRLSGALAALGVRRGDRVAIVLPQRFETAVAYMAVLQMGAVAMPLSILFGPEALEFRLNDSGAAVALCDDAAIAAIQALRGRCAALRHVIGVGADGAAGGGAAALAEHDYAAITAAQPPEYALQATRAEDPAVLIYTSGTTGNPKGALIPHRALIGNLTGFICSQNWFGFDPLASGVHGATPSLPEPKTPGGSAASVSAAGSASASFPSPGRGREGVGASTSGATPSLPEPKTPSVFWSPADWAWTGGLMDALLPTLYFGRPIVAYSGRFSPQVAFELLQKYAVTHTFLFPTALKAMMKAFPKPQTQYTLKLQAVMSAGEAVGDAVFDYCRRELGILVNEMFGQTEVNYIVGNCAMNAVAPVAGAVGWPAKPGSMGRGYPGHRVAVIDEQGRECADNEVGEVALNRYDVHGDEDPIFFLGYWKNEAATRAKYSGDWCRTGDQAYRDADGYLWYQGRTDDMFKAAGYRIGPGEIENCLVKHAAVANAAVVPKPDAERGALVKAYVVLTPEALAERGDEPISREQWDSRLVLELQRHVRGKLAPYEYPKEIEFVDALPMTTTGKVQRRVLRLREAERARQGGSSPAA